MKKKVLVSWSSGKDSAWTLQVLQQQAEIEIVGLLTTVNQHFERVAMHGTRLSLVRAQAEAAGLPLWEVPLPWPCSNEEYEQAMSGACTKAISEGITAMAFGDLFLEDVRKYREARLAGTGVEPLFPLWLRETRDLLRQMLSAGLKARMVCIDPARLPREFAGSDLGALPFPVGVDPCGENGEFHSFVYAGPMFSKPIAIEDGEVVARDGFIYADVRPTSKN